LNVRCLLVSSLFMVLNNNTPARLSITGNEEAQWRSSATSETKLHQSSQMRLIQRNSNTRVEDPSTNLRRFVFSPVRSLAHVVEQCMCSTGRVPFTGVVTVSSCTMRAQNLAIRVSIRSIRVRTRTCVSWRSQSCIASQVSLIAIRYRFCVRTSDVSIRGYGYIPKPRIRNRAPTVVRVVALKHNDLPRLRLPQRGLLRSIGRGGSWKCLTWQV
jgi:hypothetical protein